MKRFIIYVMALVLLTVVALSINDLVSYKLVMSSTSNTTYKMYRLFKQSPNDEIQILGSSRAVLHFVPSLFTQKCFNYGVRGSAMHETLLHLKHAAQINSKYPIIVNLDAWGFPQDERTIFRGDYKFVLNEPLVRETLPDELTTFSNRCLGIRFYGELRTNIATFLYARETTSKRLDNGAVLEKYSPSKREWEVIIQETLPKANVEFYCTQTYQDELDKIYKMTPRPIIWVVGPYPSVWKSKFKGEQLLKSFLAKQGSYPNVYVFDFYSTLNYSNDLFMDLTHLNQKGADKFTNDLIKSLRENSKLEVFF